MLSPVDDVGKFTIEAGEKFVGLSVLGEGNDAMITALTEAGALLKVEDYGHKYPYDWRTKKPTIFRATDQWFASVEGFRDAALAAVDTVSYHEAFIYINMRMMRTLFPSTKGQSVAQLCLLNENNRAF